MSEVIASDAATSASATTGVDDVSMRWTSGASARASVTQHGAAPGVFASVASLAAPDLAAWSGHIGAAGADFAGSEPAIAVHAIGIPRNAPIRQ